MSRNSSFVICLVIFLTFAESFPNDFSKLSTHNLRGVTGDCSFLSGADNSVWEKGEIIYKVNQTSKGDIGHLYTKNVEKVSIESQQYVQLIQQDTELIFSLTNEFKNLYEDEYFERYSVKMKFKCTNGHYNYLKIVLLDDAKSEPEKSPPIFERNIYKIKLTAPVKPNTIIQDIIVVDSDTDNTKISFVVRGNYSELFEFTPTKKLGNYYMSLLKTTQNNHLKDNISFEIIATNCANIELNSKALVEIIVENNGNEHVNKTITIETESISHNTIKISY